MDQDFLVITKKMEAEGLTLLQQIQKDEKPLVGMFWGAFGDDEWRLFLAWEFSPTWDPLKVYQYLRPTTETLFAEELKDEEYVPITSYVSVIGAREQYVRDARRWASRRFAMVEKTAPGDERVLRPLTLSRIGFYIYFLAAEK